MKRFVLAISLVMAIFAIASLVPGRAEEASKPVQQAPTNSAAGNPLKVALLKWYGANTTTSFTVGNTQNSNPYGVAFDGANIWTANSTEAAVNFQGLRRTNAAQESSDDSACRLGGFAVASQSTRCCGQ
jgi:hypothetical protein